MLLEQIQTPALVADLDIMEQNQRLINEVTARSNARLRPHYKTNKCVSIAHMQIESGAKGITCAKLGEARDLVESGIEDVLIANQITDLAKLAEVASLANCCKLTIAVDSLKNIADLQTAAAAQNATVHCLIEYEVGMGRCGVDNPEDFYTLANEINNCPNLVFEGIQAYAGHLSHEPSKQLRVEKGAELEDKLKHLKEYLSQRGIAVNEVSGCSTADIFDHDRDTVYTEYQAGSYIFMDTAYDGLKDLGFSNSLFVVTSVISNAGGKTIADAGRKSISMDQGMPKFVGYEQCEVSLSEEHATATLPGEQKPVGSTMLLIPGHCCTCINLYDYVYFIRKGKVVNKVPVSSRGKAQ